MTGRLAIAALLAACAVGHDEAAPGGGSREKNLLPWAASTAFQVSQGHNAGSHVGLGKWAWDFGLPEGTPVLAAHPGTVRAARGNSTVGGCAEAFAQGANYVVIDQGNGYESLYLHLKSTAVAVGARVQRGQVIGHSGSTGFSCGPHLHFQVQLTPVAGTPGWYNESIRDFFYDPGYAHDPPTGSMAMSRNGPGAVPRIAAATASDAPTGEADAAAPGCAGHDFHGGAGEAWDRAMQAAGSD
jgi:murein DD-endopeptidase MepM/ murein hydrolase activator NlpD